MTRHSTDCAFLETDDIIRVVVWHYVDGLTWKDIARILGLPRDKAHYVTRTLGLTRVYPGARRANCWPIGRWAAEDMTRRLVEMRAKGMSPGKIGKALGVSKGAVCGKMWRMRNSEHLEKGISV